MPSSPLPMQLASLISVLEGKLRKAILEKNWMLYESKQVIEEWNDFIAYAVGRPRPTRSQYFDVELGPEYLDAGHKSIELEGEAELAYAVKLNHEDPQTGAIQSIMVRIAKGEDPLGYARELAGKIGAEEVKFRWVSKARGHEVSEGWTLSILNFLRLETSPPRKPMAVSNANTRRRWIAAVLQRGVGRLEMGVVDCFLLRLGEDVKSNISVEVRWGDDLGLLSSFVGVRHGLNDVGIGKLLETLELRVPQHTSAEWIAVRRGLDSLASGGLALEVDPPEVLEGCYLTVAITTCKRLPLFFKTVDSFLSSLGGLEKAMTDICTFLVVDDSSPEEERREMESRYPSFTFVWKRPEDRGHARSMNAILSMVETRYLLYLEDDWLFLPGDGFSAIISEPIAALRHSQVSQILLNSQASRECAYDVPPGACAKDGLAFGGGWRRGTYVQHEFGSLHPGHDFTYWPGFSLNPGVWDLARMRKSLGEGLVFDEGDSRFEQSFSLRCYDAGLEFGYLGRVTVRHIGVEVSSYVLNGMERPFDEL